MKQILLSILVLNFFQIMNAQNNFENVYSGDDLGVTYQKNQTLIKVWSPKAESMTCRIYENGADGNPIQTFSMNLDTKNGVWKADLKGNYLNKFYTIQAKIDGKLNKEVPDPYAKAVGVNGNRGMIVDLKKTNPKNWANDKLSQIPNNESIIYELHVRDATISSNAKHKGKFLGLAEKGLKNSKGESVGLDHIKTLGITHVHLLPSFDYASVDESLENATYNWGYDPKNYNTPEGSYATNPYDGNIRIKEFKQLVQTLHKNGLNVVMDVVYNHMNSAPESPFEQLSPNYFFRKKADGSYSNASACGNEFASELAMGRKFMLESMKYWVEEYHIDGFRIDLMAIHDIETLNIIATELRKIKPNILLYGEGWTAGDSPLPEPQRALKKYASQLNDIAVFSDDIRDGLKGSVFQHQDKGFVSGKGNMEMSIKFGLVGAIWHPQVDYAKVNYSQAPYTKKASQMISYAECHDNHTLWDRLQNSNPEATQAEKIRMFLLAQTIVFCSQGIPFLHAGGEFCRTKEGEENSYKSPDHINKMDWERKTEFKQVYEYTKNMIAFRKANPSFFMPSAKEIQENMHFWDINQANLVGFELKSKANKQIAVFFNANKNEADVNLPDGDWKIALKNLIWHKKGISVQKTIKIEGQSAVILWR